MAEYNPEICPLGNLLVVIRSADETDAEKMIEYIRQVDSETPFLAREPGEFQVSVEKERSILAERQTSEYDLLLIAETDETIIAAAAVHIDDRRRYHHKAIIAVAVQKPYWSIGIGRKLMEICLAWCRERQLVKVELDVDTMNQRALSLYVSLGFEIEGTIRKDRRLADGSFRDGYRMGLMLS